VQNPLEALAPVNEDRDDPEGKDSLTEGIGLCLSGGGYRAMLFHLGALWRLNELGWLQKLNRISSVSGGSITNGVLGFAWNDLRFDDNGVALDFHDAVVDPIRRFANETIDWKAALGAVFTATPAGTWVAEAYDKHLFHEKTLQDLPDESPGRTPRFVFNATNVQTGTLFRFSKPFIWDWRVGEVRHPDIKLSCAVAASSAFPPFLSPLTLSLRDSDYVKGSGKGPSTPPYTTNPVLTDGGVYDNLGLETVWKRYRTVLVSDGGGLMGNSPRPLRNWLFHTKRVLDIVDNQVRSLRKRQVVGAFKLRRDNDQDPMWRSGAYWGIRTDIADYELADALPCPHDATLVLANEPTHLARIPERRQEEIINWGYAVSDAAMRRYVIKGGQHPPGFPYRRAGVG
jgi:NTE family protein